MTSRFRASGRLATRRRERAQPILETPESPRELSLSLSMMEGFGAVPANVGEALFGAFRHPSVKRFLGSLTKQLLP